MIMSKRGRGEERVLMAQMKEESMHARQREEGVDRAA